MSNQLPKFRSLWGSIGFENAYQRFDEFHRTSEAVLVPRWDPAEYEALHRNAKDFDGLPTTGNASKWVTPTGARIPGPESFVAGMGKPAPSDPPDDECLRLTWCLKYWEARTEQTAADFHRLKEVLTVQANQGQGDRAGLAKLEELQRIVSECRRHADAFRKQREPLLPYRLTAAGIATQQQAASQEADRKAGFIADVRRINV
jgi:hypothetical protein